MRVKAAYDTVHAQVVLCQERPDLITLDFRMPGGGGLSFYNLIRNSPETKSVPIVFVSSTVQDDEMKALVLKDPLTVYIMKPFNVTVLLNTVEKFLAA